MNLLFGEDEMTPGIERGRYFYEEPPVDYAEPPPSPSEVKVAAMKYEYARLYPGMTYPGYEAAQVQIKTAREKEGVVIPKVAAMKVADVLPGAAVGSLLFMFLR